MIALRFSFFAFVSTELGHGKIGWRLCSGGRWLDNNLLSRAPLVGELFHLHRRHESFEVKSVWYEFSDEPGLTDIDTIIALELRKGFGDDTEAIYPVLRCDDPEVFLSKLEEVGFNIERSRIYKFVTA